MKKIRSLSCLVVICLSALCVLSGGDAAQEIPQNEEFEPLVLVRIIPIPGAEGRFDHMAVDVKGQRVFAAVYGNDTVEVLHTARGRRIATIRGGLDEPQGVAYIPETNRIVVSNSGDGSSTAKATS